MLKAVAGVNWRRLGKVFSGMWGLLSSRINLDRICEEYESDEARLRAVVEEFVKLWGGSVSWRMVIWVLYGANEVDKAQQIRSYAEPLQGTLIVIHNILCPIQAMS